jgi:hypothetical protein
MSVLIARWPPAWVALAAPLLRKRYGTIVVLTQNPAEYPEADYVYRDAPVPSDPRPSEKIVDMLLNVAKVELVVTVQKLLWYSDILERRAADLGIPLVWTEAFFDQRIIVDKVGLQYCRDNELVHETGFGRLEPLLPGRTREPQPASGHLPAGPDDVFVFGQVPYDMALVQYPGLGYEAWLDRLFLSRPDTTFWFKHHPVAPTPGLERHPNVRVVDVPLALAFEACRRFAAFSSTTIFEGMCRGKWFVTGGHHFCSGHGLSVEAPDPGDGSWLDRLIDHRPDPDLVRQRLAFVCNAYTQPLDSPALIERFDLPSQPFFLRSLEVGVA